MPEAHELTNIYKAPKGLIRVDMSVRDGLIEQIRITGDFFMLPEDILPVLERHLSGVRFEEQAVGNAIESFYRLGMMITPMLGRGDLVKAVMGAKHGG
jgi:hypothetical protein